MDASRRRAILHVDMDAFYASVEQRDDPSLRGKPLAVGGDSQRGVVCAASYEARRFGVRSAMPMARARRLCPELVVVRPRFDRYAEVSEQVFEIFRAFTPLVEGLSLDEAFLDVTGSTALFGPPVAQARAVKQRVREATQLTASVGVAEVKFAAKIASDLGKPDGLTVVPEGEVRAFLAPLPVSRLWGVGPRTEEVLVRLGLRRIADVAAADPVRLERELGSAGPWLHDLANGIDPREVEPDREAKSIGAEQTFDEDLLGEALLPFLHEQSLRVASRLRRAGVRAGSVHLKVKYADFQLATRQEKPPAPTDDGAEIYRAVQRLLARVDVARPVRLTGVQAGDLRAEAPQLDLFEGAARKRERLNRSLDAIEERFGPGAVTHADLLRRGFTLVELAIVLSLIVILGGLAVPYYQRSTARAQRAEMQIALSKMRLYFTNQFANSGSYLALGAPGFRSASNPPLPAGPAAPWVPAASGWSDYTFPPDGPVRLRYQYTVVDDQHLTLLVKGNFPGIGAYDYQETLVGPAPDPSSVVEVPSF